MANNNKHTGPNVPALRFPEFSGEWESCTLGDITNNFSRRNKDRIQYPMFSVTNNRGFVPQSEQFEDREMVGEDIQAYKVIEKGDFAYNPARINVGSIAKYEGNGKCMISSLYVCFNTIDCIDRDWFMHLLKTPKMNFYYNLNGEGGVRVYLFYPNFARIRSSYPSLAEQKKIAAMLSLIDERIATQSKIIKELTTLRSALLEKVFQVSNPTLEVGAIAHQTSERNKLCRYSNVLSVSNRFGFINQSEQFEDRNVASDDVRNYKVVHRGDFAYNPARINVGSIAMLKSFESGIVSPMYICFQVDDTIVDPSFFELFLETKAFKDEMEIRLEGSVRRCLSFEALCEIHLPLPALLVQRSISNKIGNISAKIKLEDRILRAYIRQKEWLLKQMFI